MVDSSAFIHDSLNPGLKHLKLKETSDKIQSFICFVTLPLSWGQNGCCGGCSLHSSLSAESVLACPKESVRDGEGSREEAT